MTEANTSLTPAQAYRLMAWEFRRTAGLHADNVLTYLDEATRQETGEVVHLNPSAPEPDVLKRAAADEALWTVLHVILARETEAKAVHADHQPEDDK